MDLQILGIVHWFSEISYFLLGELLARCKFFSEMNLQPINIIGEKCTNLADLFPFVSDSPREIDQSQNL